MRKIVFLASTIGLCSGCWLAVMEIVLRHPGYVARLGVAACISLISLSTILAQLYRLGFRRERWLWVGAIFLILVGSQAFARNAQAFHFEGFVLVISIAIVLQGLLVLAFLGRPSRNAR